MNQGEEERARGLPVTPLFDREKVNVSISQAAFLQYVVKPCFEAMSPIAPRIFAKAMQHVDLNAQQWTDI